MSKSGSHVALTTMRRTHTPTLTGLWYGKRARWESPYSGGTAVRALGTSFLGSGAEVSNNFTLALLERATDGSWWRRR